MPLINNYTISGMESIKRFPDMDIAQVTLNSRTWPGKRHTVELLRELKPYHKSKLLIHYDFIYILSRYAMFSDTTKKAICQEISDIMHYATFDKSIIGIVMHTDWSLKKKITDSTNPDSISFEYKGSVWNATFPSEVGVHYSSWLEYNLMEFVQDFSTLYQGEVGCKIYLENTTKVGPYAQGTLSSIFDILVQWPDWKKYFGICYDTEHNFAITGKYEDPLEVAKWASDKGIDFIVHLNTIPQEVSPGSGKDMHSDNTVMECTVKSVEEYLNLVLSLKVAKIPFVREVKEDTMFRELEQLRQWQHQL